MQRQSISSSNLRSVGYDADSHTLEIEFQHGGIYQYRGVPESVYRELLDAASAGSYFNEDIRDVYLTTRVR